MLANNFIDTTKMISENISVVNRNALTWDFIEITQNIIPLYNRD